MPRYAISVEFDVEEPTSEFLEEVTAHLMASLVDDFGPNPGGGYDGPTVSNVGAIYERLED